MSLGITFPGSSGSSPDSYLDAEHEHIESPEALYRHLYEDHHVQEAGDLDPETAPVQFWLRKHAELEHAARRDAAGGPPPDAAPPVDSSPDTSPPDTSPPDTSSGSPRPATRAGDHRGDDRASGGTRRGREPAAAAGGDPLLGAVAAALVRRGHDERAVRRYIRSCPGPGGTPAGPDGFRARFIRPMLDAVGRELTATRPAPASPPAPPPPPPPAPAAASPRRRAAAAPEDDVMALANAVQRPHVRHAHPSHPVVCKLDDDVMALADAVQRHRRG